MKKIALLILISIVLLCSCATVSHYKTATVVLEGNPTTGYQWKGKSLDESIAVCGEAEYVPDQSNGMVGTGGKYYFPVKGVSQGKTQIEFTYSRTWEKLESGIRRYKDVEVKSDGSIEVR